MEKETMMRTLRNIALALTLIFLLGACNMPSSKAPTQDEPGLIHTIAAQTVEAQMTQSASGNETATTQPTQDPGQGVPTQTPIPSNTPFPTNTPPPPPTNTPFPTATQIPCDHITWGKDVTIPDNTKLVPGEVFTKTWRLKNTGACTWNSGYSLVFESGAAMGAPASQQLTTGTVAPGQEIDISVILTAPDDAGTYQGFFKLRNPNGTVFGLGNDSKPFWVKIVVPELSGVMFDFIAQADDAVWGSGVTPINFAGPGHIVLTYGGPDSDANGFAMIKNNVKLEDGSASGVILETHPKWENDGYIIGKYPAYKVGAGDRLQGRIGFIAFEDGTCGAGNAIFQIRYTVGDDLGTMTTLGEWNETCNGQMRKLDLDLTALKGKTVRFYLIVLANGAADQDWAAWASLGVFR
jgi:hypothetical protein